MTSVLSAAHFHDEAAAYSFLEAQIWPEGPICPHCRETSRISKMNGKSSHVKLHLWLQAVALLSSSKKGISSNQLHRTLGVTLKTAWFMSHRVREAMRDGKLDLLRGAGNIVEVDETYYGKAKEARVSPQRQGRPYKTGSRGPRDKRPIVALVERGARVRSFHVENADKPTVTKIVTENIARESRLHTDESRLYMGADELFASHETVRHSAGEYVRGDVHINSAEGFFSVFKRGMKAIYQHCAEKHLHRYLAEFDFRYNNRVRLGCDDVERSNRTLQGIVGKRLTYRTAH